jgi:hypothetical protein
MSDEDRLVITAPHTGSWSTADQILSSALHGEALLMARRPELRPLIDQLAEQTQGRDDISWSVLASLLALGLPVLLGGVRTTRRRSEGWEDVRAGYL